MLIGRTRTSSANLSYSPECAFSAGEEPAMTMEDNVMTYRRVSRRLPNSWAFAVTAGSKARDLVGM